MFDLNVNKCKYNVDNGGKFFYIRIRLCGFNRNIGVIIFVPAFESARNLRVFTGSILRSIAAVTPVMTISFPDSRVRLAGRWLCDDRLAN